MTTTFKRSDKSGREGGKSEGRHSAGGRNVTLTNITRRMKVYNLPHDTYCKALGRCACTIHSGRQDRRFCSSLTLASEASVSDLPQAVLSVREISLAIKAGQLAVKAENKKRAKRKKVKEVTHE